MREGDSFLFANKENTKENKLRAETKTKCNGVNTEENARKSRKKITRTLILIGPMRTLEAGRGHFSQGSNKVCARLIWQH